MEPAFLTGASSNPAASSAGMPSGLQAACGRMTSLVLEQKPNVFQVFSPSINSCDIHVWSDSTVWVSSEVLIIRSIHHQCTESCPSFVLKRVRQKPQVIYLYIYRSVSIPIATEPSRTVLIEQRSNTVRVHRRLRQQSFQQEGSIFQRRLLAGRCLQS